jgi:hypothetical protein
MAFGALPGTRTPVFALSGLWILAAMVVAIRQALDYDSTARAIAVCVVAALLAVLFAMLIGVVFGPSVS